MLDVAQEETEGLRAEKAELEASVAERGGVEERAKQAEAELIQTCEVSLAIEFIEKSYFEFLNTVGFL